MEEKEIEKEKIAIKEDEEATDLLLILLTMISLGFMASLLNLFI